MRLIDHPPGIDEKGAQMKGSCLCGEVRYEIRGDLIGINYCHCTQCRKASGSAFATNAAVRTEHFRVSSGNSLASYESSPGKKRYFCSKCGSPIYSRSESTGETVYVRIGTLDEDPLRRPDVHIHVASKAPWYDILDDVPKKQHEEGLGF